jgi:hypothetical protein
MSSESERRTRAEYDRQYEAGSLKALDPERPIREADVQLWLRAL